MININKRTFIIILIAWIVLPTIWGIFTYNLGKIEGRRANAEYLNSRELIKLDDASIENALRISRELREADENGQ